MSYILHYFKFRGRGEQVRLMLQALQQTYEDTRMSKAGFGELRTQKPGFFPFGSMPVLQHGELMLAQGPVIMGYLARSHGHCPEDLAAAALADSIALGAEDMRSKYFGLFGEDKAAKHKKFVEGALAKRWLPAFEGLLERSGSGFFVGDSWTHADIAVWDALDAVTTWVEGADLDGYPRLQANRQAIGELPGLAGYLAKRPEG